MSCAVARYDSMPDPGNRDALMPAEPEEPAQAPAAMDADPAVSKVGRFPTLTLAILVGLVAVFGAELAFGIEPMKGLLEPNVRTLLALGGLQYSQVVGSGEWYRMFLAPLMHVGLVHLLFNGVALYLAGRILEPMIGARWFAALFVVSGLAGALMSLAVNAHNIVSVGASGAIMGLFAAIWVLSYRFVGPARSRLQTASIQVLIPSMLPFASASLTKVDYGAHLGGALAGIAAALLLLKLWPKTMAHPRLGVIATIIAALGVVGVAYGSTRIPHHYKVQSYAALLIPPDQVPTTDVGAKYQAERLISEHPRDPRGYFYRALALIDAKDLPGAEHELRRWPTTSSSI
jgi:rhomboid protease GluP